MIKVKSVSIPLALFSLYPNFAYLFPRHESSAVRRLCSRRGCQAILLAALALLIFAALKDDRPDIFSMFGIQCSIAGCKNFDDEVAFSWVLDGQKEREDFCSRLLSEIGELPSCDEIIEQCDGDRDCMGEVVDEALRDIGRMAALRQNCPQLVEGDDDSSL